MTPSPDPGAFATTIATPDGPFTVVASHDAVLASGWTEDVEALCALVHPRLRPASDEVAALDAKGTSPRPRIVSVAIAAVGDYYGGDLGAPGRVRVRQSSGPFRSHAWDVLRDVAPGGPITYAEFAVRTGRPRAVRAAAGACAMNAAALFIPCHRVIRTDGSLGGFRYGLALKEHLLEREAGPGSLERDASASTTASGDAPAHQ